MSIKINIQPEAKALVARWLAAITLAARRATSWAKKKIAALKANKRAMWVIRYSARWLLVVLALVLYTIVVHRVAYKKAMDVYEGWLEDYKAEQIAAAEEAARTAPIDPYEAQLDSEAELLARVLYGVKDNKSDDLKTYCWCVFNRVDNKSFPSTLEDVIAQPQQWMRYDPTNPIIESLYQIAREQLDAWHSNPHRPVTNEYVFMNWSANDICLRDNFYEGSGTRYWRYGQ